jgi:hypothetical protein
LARLRLASFVSRAKPLLTFFFGNYKAICFIWAFSFAAKRQGLCLLDLPLWRGRHAPIALPRLFAVMKRYAKRRREAALFAPHRGVCLRDKPQPLDSPLKNADRHLSF